MNHVGNKVRRRRWWNELSIGLFQQISIFRVILAWTVRFRSTETLFLKRKCLGHSSDFGYGVNFIEDSSVSTLVWTCLLLRNFVCPNPTLSWSVDSIESLCYSGSPSPFRITPVTVIRRHFPPPPPVSSWVLNYSGLIFSSFREKNFSIDFELQFLIHKPFFWFKMFLFLHLYKCTVIFLVYAEHSSKNTPNKSNQKKRTKWVLAFLFFKKTWYLLSIFRIFFCKVFFILKKITIFFRIFF